MRTIKFRGLDAYGKLHYGDLWQRTDGTILFDHNEHVWQRIHPDSVAQFVGYDINGEEIYEGDIVRNPRDNTRFKAAMNHIYTVKIYEKEASDNA